MCFRFFMSRFGTDLNQSRDGLHCQFQMLSCLARRKQGATITSQVAIIINLN